MPRRRVLLALAAFLLAGCASAVSGSGTLTSTPAPPSSSDSASFPSDSTSVSAPVSPSVSPSLSSPVPSTSAPADPLAFTTVSFPVPSGFVPAQGYGEAIPLEASAPVQDFIVPRGGQGGLDLIAVIVYVLPTPGVATTAAQQKARIETYNAKLKAKVLAGINATTVAGRPAFQESVVQPGGSQNPRGYRYATWFVFGTTHLVQVSCQVDKSTLVTVIEKGCAAVLTSLKLV